VEAGARALGAWVKTTLATRLFSDPAVTARHGARWGARAGAPDPAAAAAHAAEQRAAFLTRLLSLLVFLDAAARHVALVELSAEEAGELRALAVALRSLPPAAAAPATAPARALAAALAAALLLPRALFRPARAAPRTSRDLLRALAAEALAGGGELESLCAPLLLFEQGRGAEEEWALLRGGGAAPGRRAGGEGAATFEEWARDGVGLARLAEELTGAPAGSLAAATLPPVSRTNRLHNVGVALRALGATLGPLRVPPAAGGGGAGGGGRAAPPLTRARAAAAAAAAGAPPRAPHPHHQHPAATPRDIVDGVPGAAAGLVWASLSALRDGRAPAPPRAPAAGRLHVRALARETLALGGGAPAGAADDALLAWASAVNRAVGFPALPSLVRALFCCACCSLRLVLRGRGVLPYPPPPPGPARARLSPPPPTPHATGSAHLC
jgi:hypothetical protein